MMNILERHLAFSVLKATAMTFIVLLIMLIFFGFIDELEDTIPGKYEAGDAFIVAMLATPRYLFETFPMAALIGSLLGLGSLATHSELIAMRAAGMSLRNMVVAILKTGILMMCVVFMFGELMAPVAEQKAQQIRAEKIKGQITLNTRYGFWARDGRSFINIRKISSGTHLEDIYIYEFDQNDKMQFTMHADKADYGDNGWVLSDIRQTQFLKNKLQSRNLEKAHWESLLDPSLLSVVVVEPTMLPIWSLSQYIDFMRSNGQSAVEYRVAFWVKIATPIATMVMLFLAVPFVLGGQRSTSMGQRIFLGVILGAGFFFLNRAMSYVAVVYDVNPLLTTGIPAGIFIAMTLLMLRKIN